MAYRLVLTTQVRDWLHELRTGDPVTRRLVADLHNLKELRPGSSGTSEVRILFIFDPLRNAVLLIAGDKSGQWNQWYRQCIPLAEQWYEAYLKELP
jgi:hypothetical protein